MRTLPIVACLSAAATLTGCASDPAASTAPQRRTTTSGDGVPLVYETRGAGTPALVFVHGWACNRHFWKEQVDIFDDEHRIITLDLGGHGESGTDRQRWDLPSLARDVTAVVEAEGLDKVILIGHSMGGPVSLMAAAEMPQRTVAVIGVDTLHDAEFTFPPPLIESLVARMQEDFAGFVRDFIRSSFAANPEADEAMIQWIIDEAAQTDPNVAMGLMRSFGELEAEAAFAACPAPVRCINAAGPMPTRIETNRKYKTDFDAVLIEQTGHFVMLERPEEFNRLLTEQLRALEAN